MIDRKYAKPLLKTLSMLAVGITALVTTLFTPFSAQARGSTAGSVGVKLVSAVKVGFGPKKEKLNAKRLEAKRFGKWITPIRSRMTSCFKFNKRKGVLKPTCVKIKLVEFQ